MSAAERGEHGFKCDNHDGLPIYHDTEADVQSCLERRTVSWSPTTEEHPERYWVGESYGDEPNK